MSPWITAEAVRNNLKTGSRLLLVSKNPSETFRAKLNQLGYSVSVVSRSFEALQALQTRAYDMVLVDLSCGSDDPYATSEMIRALEGPDSNQTPIIALTSEVIESIQFKAQKSGVTQVVAKTETLEALQKTLLSLSGRLKA